MDRVAQLEAVLAGLIDHIDHVGCYDRGGCRLDDQVPAVKQVRMVLGEEAWRQVMGAGEDAPLLIQASHRGKSA